jgi:hypothetical protein
MNGNIIADGGATTSRGFVYSASDNTPTIGEAGVTQVTGGTGTGTYANLISSLTPGPLITTRPMAQIHTVQHMAPLKALQHQLPANPTNMYQELLTHQRQLECTYG